MKGHSERIAHLSNVSKLVMYILSLAFLNYHEQTHKTIYMKLPIHHYINMKLPIQ